MGMMEFEIKGSSPRAIHETMYKAHKELAKRNLNKDLSHLDQKVNIMISNHSNKRTKGLRIGVISWGAEMELVIQLLKCNPQHKVSYVMSSGRENCAILDCMSCPKQAFTFCSKCRKQWNSINKDLTQYMAPDKTITFDKNFDKFVINNDSDGEEI